MSGFLPKSGTSAAENPGFLPKSGSLELIPYWMAGYPDRAASIEMAKRMATSGAWALEIGVPFSDPLADGPTVQAVGQKALAQGMTLAGALEVAQQVAAEQGAPIALMTYLNPILAYDPRRFARDAAQVGVAGVIVPDLPVEEAAAITEPLREAGVAPIFLVAPTSSDDRIAAICSRSQGFIYCVTLTGTTGARASLPAGLGDLLDRVHRHTELPVAAGFGIATPQHLDQLRGHADAAVVASALLAVHLAGDDPFPLLSTLLASCRSEG